MVRQYSFRLTSLEKGKISSCSKNLQINIIGHIILKYIFFSSLYVISMYVGYIVLIKISQVLSNLLNAGHINNAGISWGLSTL